MDTDYRPQHTRKRSSSARPRMQQGPIAGADYSANTLDAKVVILGRQGVGKTSLVRRYTSNTFHPPSTQSTTGAFFVTKKCTLDGVGVRLQIWDTAGQERFRSMAPMYIRGAHAAVVVYDLTSEQSFEDVRGWIDELKKSTPPSTLVYVVGSKSDLCPQHRAVTPSHARASLLRWYPPPPPSTIMSPLRPSPPRRPRLISLPTSLPMSRSTPALQQFPTVRHALSGSVSGPPTPGDRGPLTAPPVESSQFGYATGRPRLVSSPSSPAHGMRLTASSGPSYSSHSHSNGHDRHDKRSNGHAHSMSYAPPARSGRAWSWGSSPDEKEESPSFQRTRTTHSTGSHFPPAQSASYDPSPDRGLVLTSSSGPDSAEEESTSSHTTPEEAEDEELEEDRQGNWELVEVSAKDDVGVQGLFEGLIRRLLERRGEIMYERELKTRGSVMLRPNEDSGVKKLEEESRGWGACCSV